MSDEFRVEVDLGGAERGFSVAERLRAHDLDEDALRRLGSGVMVTRDGSRLFAYAASDADAHEAELAIRTLFEADELTAKIAVTRWHELEEAWKDASIPLPTTDAEERAELAALEASEAREAAAEGRYDWEVVVRMPDRGEARELERRLTGEGVPIRRRWRYVAAGAASEQRAEELAARLRSELPDADVEIDIDLSDVARSPLQFLPF
jgi:hypothetical protein